MDGVERVNVFFFFLNKETIFFSLETKKKKDERKSEGEEWIVLEGGRLEVV